MINNKSKNKQKGITLIALVITIIVLLILAGVAISMLSGENGILRQAVKAKQETESATKIENIKLAVTSAMMNKDHKIEKEKLEKELEKVFKDVKVDEDNGFIIEADGNIYMIDEKGIISEKSYAMNEQQSDEGKITIADSSGKKLTDYKIYGNSVQNGTPAPDNPIEIQSVGDKVTDESEANRGKYKIPVTVSGKNLFNKDTIGSVFSKEKDGDRNIIRYKDGYSTGTTYKDYSLSNNIVFKENTQYTFSFEAARPSLLKPLNFWVVYTDGTKYQTATANITQLGEYVKVVGVTRAGKTVESIYTGDNYAQTAYIDIDTIQIEEGTTATAYEQYIEPKIYNIYLNEPLRKIGDYADYIDFKNKKVVRNISTDNIKAHKSSAIGTYSDDIARFYCYPSNGDRKFEDASKIAIMSDSLQGVSRDKYLNSATSNIQSITGEVNSNVIFFKISKNLIGGDTVEIVNSYLEKNPIKIYYILKTQKEESIEIPNIITREGTNIITIDTLIKPSNIEITYIQQNN